jgi:hypothetical protein
MKDNLYHDRLLTNMFFVLVVEIFGCLHQQTDEFHHQYANMAWGVKYIRDPRLLVKT